MNDTTAMLVTPAPHSVASIPLQIARLVAQCGANWVNADNLDALLAQPGDTALFIPGDPLRFPEALDVAVVLPELQRSLKQRFRVAVAECDSEDALARRYGATRRPALVFLRDGQYVTNLSGMLDWDVYLVEVVRALALPVSRAPGIGIPLVAAGAGACNA